MSQIFLQGPQPAFAFETLTVTSGAAVALTRTVYETFESTNQTRKQAKLALISVEGANARFRVDGSAPDATTGHLIAASTTSPITIELMSITQIKNAKFIATAGDVTLQVTYFGS